MAVLEELAQVSSERFLAMYQALSQQGYGPLDHELARALKFRPHAIKKLPMETRARRARTLVESKKSPELCYEFFGTYLVRTKKELVTGFLDRTGVSHKDGMIEDIDGQAPDPAKIGDAVRALDAAFDPEDVTLYLALCVEQWPANEGLAQAWKARR